MTKSDIRKEKLRLRSELSEEEIILKSSLICKRLINSDAFCRASVLLSYMDFNNEVMTEEIIKEAVKTGKRVFLPAVCKESLTMDFYEVKDFSTLKDGYFGIKEPSKSLYKLSVNDIKNNKIFMTVPGVAFNNKGFRIGYGKGFYDKYLSQYNEIYKCGLCYEIQLTVLDFAEITDVKMDSIVTEERIINGDY